VSELEKTRGAGRLYLCATPIGNLEDITLRALRVLREVDWIAAEDTRHTLKLLRHYDIRTPVISYHEHNEAQRSQELIQRLLRGEEGALVSDAGTPVISDPGYPLVRLAIDSGIPVLPLPGPSALTAALIVSGLPPHPFYFGGFLPRREKERKAALQAVAGLPATLVFYEAPHRLRQTLQDAARVLPGRRAAVARELTKVHEEVIRGTIEELVAHFAGTAVRGECVLLIEGAKLGREEKTREQAPSETEIREALEAEIRSGATRKEAIERVASLYGIGRNWVYRLSLDIGRRPT